MKGQSLEFNIGYAFHKLERHYIDTVRHHWGETVDGAFYIPKCWFGLRPIRDTREDLACMLKSEMISSLKDVFGQLAPKYELSMKITPENQYMKFEYTMKKKPEIKKMTVTEIEKILGYKIEIVSGDIKDEEEKI